VSVRAKLMARQNQSFVPDLNMCPRSLGRLMEGGPTFVHMCWCASARTEVAVARKFVQLQRAHGAASLNPNPSAATLALALSSKQCSSLDGPPSVSCSRTNHRQAAS
jgi:hypothetical protein